MLVWVRSFCLSVGCVNVSILKLAKSHLRPEVIRFEGIRAVMGKSKGSFYAVARGRSVGIYHAWSECEEQVKGFPNARYKCFKTEEDAQSFIKEHQVTPAAVSDNLLLHSNAAEACKPKETEKFYPQQSTRKCKQLSDSEGLRLAYLNNLTETALLGKSTRYVVPKKLERTKRDYSSLAVSSDKSGLKVTEVRRTNKRLKSEHSSNDGVDLADFKVDADGYVVVYTDGACSHNGRQQSRAGIGVWFGKDHKLNLSEPVQGRMTNNTAEIQAAERAILQAKENGIDKLNIQTDSQFLINCATAWMKNWKKNGWKRSGGSEVINRVDLEKLEAAMLSMDIKWSYVPAHQGHEGNEAADNLAVAGAQM